MQQVDWGISCLYVADNEDENTSIILCTNQTTTENIPGSFTLRETKAKWTSETKRRYHGSKHQISVLFPAYIFPQ